MKNSLMLFFLFGLILVMASWTSLKAEKEIAFYVSPVGNDLQARISVDKAFATLQKARDAIRAIKSEGQLKL